MRSQHDTWLIFIIVIIHWHVLITFLALGLHPSHVRIILVLIIGWHHVVCVRHCSRCVLATTPHWQCTENSVCLNSFSNQLSPSENSNDCWKRLCLVSWAAAPCVWTLRALTINLLTYLLMYREETDFSKSSYCSDVQSCKPRFPLKWQKQISGLFYTINPRKSWHIPVSFREC